MNIDNSKNLKSWPSAKTTKHMFYEVATQQSGVGECNSDIPDSLITPLVCILDPCSISSLHYADIDWNSVSNRLRFPKSTSAISVDGMLDNKRPDHSKTQQGSSGKRQNITSEDNSSLDCSVMEHSGLNKQKNELVEEVIELVQNIRKYSDGAVPATSGWIEKESIVKLSKVLVITLSYLPDIVSLQDVINAFLYENGLEVLEKILIEMPELVHAISNLLVRNRVHGSRNRKRIELINTIIAFYPQFALKIIEEMGQSRNDYISSVKMACQFFSDTEFLNYLEPLLINKESHLSKNLSRNGGKQFMSILIDRLMTMSESVFNTNLEDLPDVAKAPWCTKLVYCWIDIICTTEWWLNEERVRIITKFIFRTGLYSKRPVENSDSVLNSLSTSTDMDFDSFVSDSQESQPGTSTSQKSENETQPSPFGDYHETLLLAAIIAIPLFSQYPLEDTMNIKSADISLDRWLVEARRRTRDQLQKDSYFASNLLYVHSCTVGGKINELLSFASDILKRKVELTTRPLQLLILKDFFAIKCMDDVEVGKRCAALPVTKNMSDQSYGRLAIHSIIAVQAGGVFSKEKIDISSWIEKQLRTCSYPASSDLLDLIDAYSSVSVHSNRQELSEEFIRETFEGDFFDESKLMRRLYILYYLAAYRENLLRFHISLRWMKYSPEIFEKLPVRYLMSVMEARPEHFQKIRSAMFMRVSASYSFLMPTAKSMDLVRGIKIEMKTQTDDLEKKHARKFTNENIQKMCNIISSGKPTEISKILDIIDNSSLECQLGAIPVVIECFMKSLDGSMPPAFERKIVHLFERFEQIDTRRIYNEAVKRWIKHDEDLSLEDIYRIPTLIFRVDRRILSSPAHFECFIKCVHFFSISLRIDYQIRMRIESARMAMMKAHHKPVKEGDKREKDHMTMVYVDSQHSSTIHALLETCDSVRMKDDPKDFAQIEKRKQISNIAFEYIHRCFVDHHGLMRVVLYQKFPLRQIRPVVEGVPSMFAFNSYIYEILSLADTQRRIFGVVLAAEICRKYRVKECLDVARVACDVVHTLFKHGEFPASNKIWKHLSLSLIIISKEFPSLTDSITRLLNRVVANAKCRLAIRCRLLSGDQRHEEHELIETITSYLDRDRQHVENLFSKTSISNV